MNQSPLTELALSAARKKREDEIAAAAARDQEEAELRAEFVRSYLERVGPIVLDAVAAQWGIPHDSPALVDLQWRLSPEDLRVAFYKRNPETGHVEANFAQGARERLHLWADIDALTISVYLAASVPVVRAHLKFTTLGIGDLADLGEAIEKARKELAEESAA
ncbi:hypothetical protein [Leifsonia sp. ALI-44-B]|uniref:hypothetical protein n=1 Tax=Leifsonia sp. ALI-44-B TaxID=1933776 RepID=UPI0011798E0A|nr:hypothetical protein [Leifsonia sp. ALI-44-B]